MAFIAPRLVPVAGMMAFGTRQQGMLAGKLGELLDLTAVAGVAVLLERHQVGETVHRGMGIKVAIETVLEIGAMCLTMALSALRNYLLPVASRLPGVKGFMALGTVHLMLAATIADIRKDRHMALGAFEGGQRLDRLLIDAGGLTGSCSMRAHTSINEQASQDNQRGTDNKYKRLSVIHGHPLYKSRFTAGR